MKQIKTITFLLSFAFSVFFTGQALSSYPEKSDPADAGDLLITERQVADWAVGFKPSELQVSDTAGTIGLQPNNVNDQAYEVSDWRVVGQPQRPVVYLLSELQVSDNAGGLLIYQSEEDQAYEVADLKPHFIVYENDLEEFYPKRPK